ncbi:hypothetical protein VPH35_058798 [Triticum aestivum]
MVAALPPAEGRGLEGSVRAWELGGLSSLEWSTFRRRGREILLRSSDRQRCLRLMQERAEKIFKARPIQVEIKKVLEGIHPAESVDGSIGFQSSSTAANPGNQFVNRPAVSKEFKADLKNKGNGLQVCSNLAVNFGDSEAESEEKPVYFKEGGGGFQFALAPRVCSPLSVLSVLVAQVAMGDQDKAKALVDADGAGVDTLPVAAVRDAGSAAEVGTGLDRPAVQGVQLTALVQAGGVAVSPLSQMASEPSGSLPGAAVGGPSGMALSVTPSASFGFAAGAVVPPPLRRAGKSKGFAGSRADMKPLVIDLEAAFRAVARKLAVARVLLSYSIDPRAVVGDLRGPWKLRGNAVAQRVESKDGRFVISEEGDLKHVLQAGPWHFRNNAVLIAALDGKTNPVDVCLDSFLV